jgi:hypothetical protein
MGKKGKRMNFKESHVQFINEEHRENLEDLYELLCKKRERKLMREFLDDLNELDYWITDNQERTKDEYDRKIVDWKELYKYILFEKEKWEKRYKE